MVRRRNPASLIAISALLATASVIAAAGSSSAVEPEWFDLPTADSFPQGIAAGPDGGMWVAARFADQIIRIALDGSASPFGLESGVEPFTIVEGPDGAMWFTEHNGSRIGRLTLEGDLLEFPVADRANPTAIAVGSDSALWFTERGVSSIGRVTLDGQVTEWPTATPRAAPLSIVGGSDGALWFTEPAVNKIGRITTDGSITEFALPTPVRNPQWIAAGPDGALWFTERATNGIGRMTVSGELTEFAVPTPSAGVMGITSGPDGAVWFTESSANVIGRLTTLGEITEIPLGAVAIPTGIATGPDGLIWFSAPGLNRVGRLVATAPADVTPPTVNIVSPRNGSILLQGEGMLADYSCADEPGGSGLVSCKGPVPNGAVVPTPLGSNTFTVTATDGAGNVGSATNAYVVFAGISGPITSQAVFAAGRTIPIILDLGARPAGTQIFATGSPTVRQVDCTTHDAIGPDAPANVQPNLTSGGRLQLLWRTGAGWAGSCRSLVVRLGFDGWSSADAVFTVRFA